MTFLTQKEMYLRVYETLHSDWLAEPITEALAMRTVEDPDNFDIYILKTSDIISWPEEKLLSIENEDMPEDLQPWEITPVRITQSPDGLRWRHV